MAEVVDSQWYCGGRLSCDGMMHRPELGVPVGGSMSL